VSFSSNQFMRFQKANMLRRRIRLKRKEYRIGKDAKCEYCPETDLRALDKFDGAVLCRNCRLTQAGKSVIERHHFSGRNNDEFLLAIPANEHAVLSDYQQDWPEETMKNPHRKILPEIAAWLRAIGDFEKHVIERSGTQAERLERLSKKLEKRFGSNWDKDIEIEDNEENDK